MRLLFFFKRLRSTYLGREKLQQQQHQCPAASFFFLTFFVLVTVVGNTSREELPRVKDSLGFWIPRSGFQIPGTWFRSLLVKFGFLIPIFSRVLYSVNCIPDSKAQDSRFHKKKFPGFWNPDFLDTGARRGGACSQRPCFPFFYDLLQGVEFYWLPSSLGISRSFSFPFLSSCARVLYISPFALIKPGACYAGYNNLKAEPGNSVTNCILMSDTLVLLLNKNQRTLYIHKSIISEEDIKHHIFYNHK